MAESVTLEAFKKCVDVSLRDMVCGHGGDRSTIGLDDISGLFLSQIFYEHMILYWVYIVPEDSFSDVHKVEPEF